MNNFRQGSAAVGKELFIYSQNHAFTLKGGVVSIFDHPPYPSRCFPQQVKPTKDDETYILLPCPAVVLDSTVMTTCPFFCPMSTYR